MVIAIVLLAWWISGGLLALLFALGIVPEFRHEPISKWLCVVLMWPPLMLLLVAVWIYDLTLRVRGKL